MPHQAKSPPGKTDDHIAGWPDVQTNARPSTVLSRAGSTRTSTGRDESLHESASSSALLAIPRIRAAVNKNTWGVWSFGSEKTP
jgi:hypothetical protein